MDDPIMTVKEFQKYIDEILTMSNNLFDDWNIIVVDQNIENNKFLTRKQTAILHGTDDPDLKIVATFEYHIVYNISYAVPVLCFDIWRQDGTGITLEEYWKYNKNLHEYNMHDTLTQMDHPVLNRPIFTLHPCKTHEIIQPFLKASNNPIISWLSVVSRFMHLEVLEEYFKNC